MTELGGFSRVICGPGPIRGSLRSRERVVAGVRWCRKSQRDGKCERAQPAVAGWRMAGTA